MATSKDDLKVDKNLPKIPAHDEGAFDFMNRRAQSEGTAKIIEDTDNVIKRSDIVKSLKKEIKKEVKKEIKEKFEKKFKKKFEKKFKKKIEKQAKAEVDIEKIRASVIQKIEKQAKAEAKVDIEKIRASAIQKIEKHAEAEVDIEQIRASATQKIKDDIHAKVDTPELHAELTKQIRDEVYVKVNAVIAAQKKDLYASVYKTQVARIRDAATAEATFDVNTDFDIKRKRNESDSVDDTPTKIQQKTSMPPPSVKVEKTAVLEERSFFDDLASPGLSDRDVQLAKKRGYATKHKAKRQENDTLVPWLTNSCYEPINQGMMPKSFSGTFEDANKIYEDVYDLLLEIYYDVYRNPQALKEFKKANRQWRSEGNIGGVLEQVRYFKEHGSVMPKARRHKSHTQPQAGSDASEIGI